jgi:hypothetical protein
MNLDPDPHRSRLVDENVDVGDLDISLVEKNDISLSDILRRENDRAIALRGGLDDRRISDQYGLERLIDGKRRDKIRSQVNSLSTGTSTTLADFYRHGIPKSFFL